MSKWYQIRAAVKPKTADIHIFGDIGESWWTDETVTAKQFVQDLEKLVDVDTLNIRINSYGGAVSDGLAIYNALRRHPAAKAVTIEGVAVSIASLIAMAGDTVDMPANSLLMIHAPWSHIAGNSAELRTEADVLDRHARAMASSYTRKTGKSEADMLALLTDGADHWYTAQEALDAGFADTVSDALQAAASIPSRYRCSGAPIMPGPNPPTTPPVSTPTSPPPASSSQNIVDIRDAAKREALATEQTRRREIRGLLVGSFAKREDLRAVMDACLDDPDCSSDEASKRLLRKLGEGCEPLSGAQAIVMGQDASDKFRASAVQSILARGGIQKHDGANPCRGFRMAELARACIEYGGGNVSGQVPEEYVPLALGSGRRRAAGNIGQTSSDFPVILEEAMHKIALTGFNAMASKVTYPTFCKIGDVTDFREWKRIVPGLIGNLDDVNEQGEYLNKNIPDGEKNGITAKRRGNIITITPETIINDDLGYIIDFARNMGMAGPRSIERRVYLLLESNPTLSDGVALFHASHGNLSSTSDAISVAPLDAASAAMGQQKAPGDDQEYLDITPDVLLCHRGKAGNAKVVVNAEYDPDTANKLQKPNAVRGIVSNVVSSPRLSANPWYLFADPTVAPVIEVVFVNGQRDPRIVEEESFRTGGISWRIELPFGVGAIDFRGGYKNPGA